MEIWLHCLSFTPPSLIGYHDKAIMLVKSEILSLSGYHKREVHSFRVNFFFSPHLREFSLLQTLLPITQLILSHKQ